MADMTVEDAIAYIARQFDAGWVPFDYDENNYTGWSDDDDDDDDDIPETDSTPLV